MAVNADPPMGGTLPLEQLAMGGYRMATRIFSWYISVWDQLAISGTPFPAVPPIYLRHRVHGDGSLGGFLQVGQRSRQDLEAALGRIGRRMSDFSDVMDFGCGCGRTLLWLSELAGTTRLYGTDTDAEAAEWCRRNLPFATFTNNRPMPPLDYPEGSFDLVYAISVLTHLDEEYQCRWLEELRRVTRPGGVLLLTVHGPDRVRGDLGPELQAQVHEKGILFVPSLLHRGIFPEWYQLTYHSREYVEKTFARYFRVLDYIPLGLNAYQDIVVLERTP
ncbi:class I SAM-dependent methyltransferase [Longimicrobium sp.]|jgi:SAM-dependent methyltransferase|uniref:class I SAM-dependent methyltransferase n=1 Tax=Longimicrobium sp. TaxID=2029185 RepID=UPI002F9474F2